MKNNLLAALILVMGLLSFPTFSQTENDTTSLGLPGDNLDLYAVLDLFKNQRQLRILKNH